MRRNRWARPGRACLALVSPRNLRRPCQTCRPRPLQSNLHHRLRHEGPQPDMKKPHPPPPPHPATAERRQRTRTTPAGAASSSHPSASSWAPKCVACWIENRDHVAHTYADDCVVQSGRRIYGQAPQTPSLSAPEGPPSSYQSLPEQPELSPQAHQHDPHAQYTSSSQHDATRSAQNADTRNDSAHGGGARTSFGCSSDPMSP